jgi:PAS domain S-box-containing protein
VDTATTRYTAAWIGVAAVAIVATPFVAGLPAFDLGAVGVYVLAVALAERTQLAFHLERATVGYTLIEVAITAGVLLLPLAYVVPATAVGILLAELTRLHGPVGEEAARGGFNMGVASLGTLAAGTVVALWPPVGPLVQDRAIVGALVGMLLYVAVNALAMSGLLLRIGGPDAPHTIRDQLPLTLAAMIGSTAVGVVLAALWTTQPVLVAFLLAPALAIHLAARGQLRSAALLAEMRSERNRLERVVDGASDGILLLDHDGTVLVWNTAMAQMTGIPAERAAGRPVAAVLGPEVRRAETPVRGRWVIDDAYDGATQRTSEAQLVDPEGTVRDVRESHALVFDERGRCTGDVAIVRDVSRQLQLERLRSDFVARVSHELRTPLTPIRGFASMLLQRGEDLGADERVEVAARIVERADHLHGLVEDLLLVTRMERDELDGLIDQRPFEVGEVAARAVETARANAPDRLIALEVAPGTGPALGDPDRVRWIAEALLDNAARYSPDDTPIEVTVDQQGDDVRVLVRDHGPGVPRDQRDAIFEQFHRLEDPLTMRTSGVGLGLYIARRLADAMHGSLVLATSGPDRGASFELRLPAVEPAATPAQRLGN